MDISAIINELDNIPVAQSQYEFDNFFLETFPTKSRQLVAVMLEIEKLHATKISLEFEFAHHSTNAASLHRELTVTTQKLNRLCNWYESISEKERVDILKNYEAEEPHYWAHVIGKRAALEVLSLNRTVTDTIAEMVNLPIEDFEEAVRICTKYTTLVNSTTQSVENSMNNDVNGIHQG